MSFANPVLLWSLLAIIPLIGIYFLKVKPIRKPTTALFLWDEIFQQSRARSLFQRMRDLFSLLIMILVFALLALAMSGFRWTTGHAQNLVLILDNSASMEMEEQGTRRLDLAKQTAREIVTGLNGNQRCSIVSVSNRMVFHSNMTENPRELLAAIDRIEADVVPLDESLLSQLSTAENGMQDGQPDSMAAVDPDMEPTANRMILVSDGCVQAMPPAGIELLKVGDRPIGNVGIVACDFQRMPGGQNQVAAFLQLGSSFESAIDVDVAVYWQAIDDQPTADSEIEAGLEFGELVKLVPMSIEPGIARPEILYFENAKSGRWTVELDVSDGMKTDNFAYAVVPDPRPIPVQVLASDRYFFENSVRAFSENGGILTLEQQTPDLAVIQGKPESIADGSWSALLTDAVIFHPTGDAPWWTALGAEIEVSLPRVIDPEHPVLRHLDASTIPFVGARQLTAPAGAEVLVAAEDETPLIYRVSRAGQSVVVVNLDPTLSDFYLSAWFPILVYSSATSLSGREEPIRSTYATGQTVRIPSKQTGGETRVVTPAGVPFQTEELTLDPLREIGFYSIDNDTGRWQFGSGLYSKTETSNRGADIAGNARPIDRGRSAVGWLTLAAILLVVGESLLYQRRKVG